MVEIESSKRDWPHDYAPLSSYDGANDENATSGSNGT